MLPVIYKTTISVNDTGLYRLNDIHAAAKAGKIIPSDDKNKTPGEWYKNVKAKEQIELEKSKSLTRENSLVYPYQTTEGRNGGTWANKRLALKYAAWISVEFEDTVYDVFEAYLDGKLAAVQQPTIQLLPTQMVNEGIALESLTHNNFPTLNPNIIQMMRDAAQNNLMVALGCNTPLLQHNTNLIIGVVEIAKRYIGEIIDPRQASSLGKYVAKRINQDGLHFIKVERVCTGEMRAINGYEQQHHEQIVVYIKEWLESIRTLKVPANLPQNNNLFGTIFE